MRFSSTSAASVAALLSGVRVAAQLKPNNLVAASTSGSLSALKYTNVGGSGEYDQVTDIIPGTFPTCDANPFCITQPKQISGNLAPFDDEITIAFRGPLNLYNVAVYQPTNASGATWKQVSSWAANEEPTNLVFMNNMGGQASGEWSICAGSSQSYASGNWTAAVSSANAQPAQGSLPAGHEVNIMTGETCASRACAGFSRGTANHGWAGSKFFVFTFDMPSPPTQDPEVPAIWALNAQIVRAAQYGCNCRGVGPKGCGEVDLLETVAGTDPDQAISEIYSPKGATGTGRSFFARPTGGRVTYGAIFDVQSDSIAVQRYTEWNYAQNAITRSVVEGYLNAPAMTVSFDGANGKRAEMPRSVMGAHRRRRWH
ncbi:putative TOS1-like glycosyl hydrolase-domain-containing protein [Trametes meyenii]|nr:putative TOS1-like glycosyl hydrolase-domain-containing protein [Trametes meyenii]